MICEWCRETFYAARPAGFCSRKCRQASFRLRHRHHEAQRVCLAAVEYDRALLMAAHEDLKARGLSAGVLSLPDKDPVLRATLGAIRRKRAT